MTVWAYPVFTYYTVQDSSHVLFQRHGNIFPPLHSVRLFMFLLLSEETYIYIYFLLLLSFLSSLTTFHPPPLLPHVSLPRSLPLCPHCQPHCLPSVFLTKSLSPPLHCLPPSSLPSHPSPLYRPPHLLLSANHLSASLLISLYHYLPVFPHFFLSLSSFSPSSSRFTFFLLIFFLLLI